MIKKAHFIKSAKQKEGWIIDDIPELCFIGRSNVGKSSFINAITNQKKLAKTSSTPGKTKLLNFFDVNDQTFRIVDVPGYGFSKTTHNEKQEFSIMMEEYFQKRTNLAGVVLLLDLRRIPNNDDLEMYNYLKKIKLPVLIVGTKLDKLSKNEIKKNEKQIIETLKISENDDFIKISNSKRTNINLIYENLIKLLKRGWRFE